MDEKDRDMFQEWKKKVEFQDEQRDHSILNQEEQNEISLFHSMKQDPYYRHYLHNHLRKYAEDEDEINLNYPLSSIQKEELYDHVKFDKLNLFDFRRNIPRKAR